MKYTEKQWQELADKVALLEQLTEDIENAKIDIRQMTKEEIINKYVKVTRSNNTTTTYPENYKTELDIIKNKLKEKYASEITTVTKENYSIKLTAMKQAQVKANTIANEVIQMSNTALKRVAASKAPNKSK